MARPEALPDLGHKGTVHGTDCSGVGPRGGAAMGQPWGGRPLQVTGHPPQRQAGVSTCAPVPPPAQEEKMKLVTMTEPLSGIQATRPG